MWVVKQSYIDYENGKVFLEGDIIRDENMAKHAPDGFLMPCHTEQEAETLKRDDKRKKRIESEEHDG